MRNTTNFNLSKPDYSNTADIKVINNNFDKIDNGIAPFFVATLKSANVYEIATGNTVTSLSNGFGIRIAIPSDSTGAVSIVVDGLTAVLVKKPNGGAVSNFKANGVYALTYYNGNFILVSGGGCDGDKVTATEKDVLINKTYIGSDEEVHTGSMPELGTVTKQLGINETFSLGEGHINGLRVTQNITSLTGHQNATQYTYWPIGTSGNSQPVAFLKPPLPAYYYGDAWIRQEMPYLQPQYIVAGANIFGCAGSATIESLGGARYSSGTKAGGTDHTVSCPFEPDLVVMYSYYGANASNYISIVAKNGFMGTSYRYLMFTYDVDSPGKIEGALPSYYGYSNGVLTLPILDTNTRFTHKYIAFKF